MLVSVMWSLFIMIHGNTLAKVPNRGSPPINSKNSYAHPVICLAMENLFYVVLHVTIINTHGAASDFLKNLTVTGKICIKLRNVLLNTDCTILLSGTTRAPVVTVIIIRSAFSIHNLEIHIHSKFALQSNEFSYRTWLIYFTSKCTSEYVHIIWHWIIKWDNTTILYLFLHYI
jgi:hypothetical protein